MCYVIGSANHPTDVQTPSPMLPGPVLIMTLRLPKVTQSQPTCHPWPYHNSSRWKWCIFHQYFCCFSTQVGDTKTKLPDMWGSWTGTPKSWGGVCVFWKIALEPAPFFLVCWLDVFVLGWSKSSEREAFREKWKDKLDVKPAKDLPKFQIKQ